jgi:hypothetical protein
MTSDSLQQWFSRFVHTVDRAPMAGLMCAGAILLGIALAGARTTLPAESGAPPSSDQSDTRRPLLEGTELREELGTFHLSGNRVTFVSAGQKRRFTALENLTIERVAQSLADNPLSQQWIVSGTVTEYRGNNYLLVTRAVMKTPPRPEENKP